MGLERLMVDKEPKGCTAAALDTIFEDWTHVAAKYITKAIMLTGILNLVGRKVAGTKRLFTAKI